MAGLNNAPLRVRFDAAITQVGAPVTRTEVEVLWKARAFRNRLEHGGDLKEPEHGIVQEAIGVLNRLLVETLIATAPDEDGVRSDSSES